MVYRPRFSKPAQDLHIQEKDDDSFGIFSAGSNSDTHVKYGSIFLNNPIPIVNISYSGNHNGAGDSYGVYRITLTGRAFATTNSSGSNASSGSVYSVLNRIYNLPDGETLEIKVCGVAKSYCNCKVVDESYSETSDNWTNTISYSIVLESTGCCSSSGSYSSGSSGASECNIVSFSESWTEEDVEDAPYSNYEYSTENQSSGINLGPVASQSSSGSFLASVGRTRITHRISAKATNPSNPGNAYLDAKSAVMQQIDSSGSSGSTNKYNRYSSTSYDISEGTYEVTEGWITSSKSYIMDLSIEESADIRGISTVRVQGQVQGMTLGYIGSSGVDGPYNSALTGFNSIVPYSLANSISSATLNTRLISSSVGHNISKGTISFSYEYDSTPFFVNSSGASILSENISINDTGAADVFSEIPVLGRALGPVIQNLGTKTSYKKDINIEVVVQNTGQLNVGSPPSAISNSVNALVNQVKPFSSSGDSDRGFALVSSDNTTWSPTEARFSRSVSWTYSYCSTEYLPG